VFGWPGGLFGGIWDLIEVTTGLIFKEKLASMCASAGESVIEQLSAETIGCSGTL
jgi:hypothetical protein